MRSLGAFSRRETTSCDMSNSIQCARALRRSHRCFDVHAQAKACATMLSPQQSCYGFESHVGPSHLEVNVEFMFMGRPPLFMVICIDPFTVSEFTASTRKIPVDFILSVEQSMRNSCLVAEELTTVRVQDFC